MTSVVHIHEVNETFLVLALASSVVGNSNVISVATAGQETIRKRRCTSIFQLSYGTCFECCNNFEFCTIVRFANFSCNFF